MVAPEFLARAGPEHMAEVVPGEAETASMSIPEIALLESQAEAGPEPVTEAAPGLLVSQRPRLKPVLSP